MDFRRMGSNAISGGSSGYCGAEEGGYASYRRMRVLNDNTGMNPIVGSAFAHLRARFVDY